MKAIFMNEGRLVAYCLGWLLLCFVVIFPAIGETFYAKDSAGTLHVMDTADPESPYRLGPSRHLFQLKQTGVFFEASFDDVDLNNGLGFDDAAEGEARRAVVGRIFAFLNSILNHEGAVSVLFAESLNDGGLGILASAGAFFNITPGFRNGTVFTRITTGVDGTGPDIPEMIVTVNFGHPWFTGTGDPPLNEFDLFSVLLHEMTHGLGIASLADETGADSFASNLYTVWDSFLERGNGRDLFGLEGGIPEFLGSPGDLTSDDVVFAGPRAREAFGSNPPVFAPVFFSDGSSLSHFDATLPESVVMTPGIAPGVAARSYEDFEIGALIDLGYEIVFSDACLTRVALLNPADNAEIVFPADADSAFVVFWADPNCEVQTDSVEFTLDGNLIGTSIRPPFALGADVGPGPHILTATSTNAEVSVADTIVFTVRRGVTNDDINGDGYPDAPLDTLFDGNDQWAAQILDPATGLRRIVGATRVAPLNFGDSSTAAAHLVLGTPGGSLSKIIVSARRALLSFRETGVLLAAAAPDLETLLGPDEAANVSALPPGVLSMGGFFVEISFLVIEDGSIIFEEVDNALLSVLPVHVIMDGLDPGAAGPFDVFSYPTQIGRGPGGALTVFAQDGEWSVSSISNLRVGPTGFEADLTSLSIVAPLEMVPSIEISPVMLDFGDVALGETLTLPLMIRNVGGGTLTGLSSVSSPFSTVSGASYSLEPGDRSEVEIAFSPTVRGDFEREALFSGGGGGTATVRGTGGVTPVLSVFPSRLDFGVTELGTTLSAEFRIVNTGTGFLEGGASTGPPFGVVSSPTYRLGAGESTAITVSFAPTIAGEFSGVFSFVNAGGAMAARSVSGTGAVPALLVVTPLSFDFGDIDVGEKMSTQFTVTNIGGGLVVGSASASTPFGVGFGGSYVLGAGETQNVNVSFTPIAGGASASQILFSGGRGASRSVMGSGTVPPILSVSPASHDFGAVIVGETVSMTFTVANVGGLSLSGTATIAGPFAVTSGAEYSLEPGATAEVTVSFIPPNLQSFTQSLFLTGGGDAEVVITGSGAETLTMGCGVVSRDGREGAEGRLLIYLGVVSILFVVRGSVKT